MNARALTLTLMLVLSTFSTVFVPQPTAVLTEANEPLLAGNTTDCGTNASNVSFEVEAYQPVWNRYDTVSAFLDTYCGVWWETYRVDWLLVSQDNNSLIDYGQSTFTTNNSSVTYHPNHTDHFNEVDVHFHYMDTGNYSLSGDFYVLDNTTWTWLANVSNTFQVNGTNTTTACGYNDTLVSMETDISSNYYIEGASAYPWSDIECPVLGTPYGYSWELFDQNSSAVFQTGSSNFTATWQNVHLFADGSGIYHDINLAIHNLTEGVYTLSTVLTLSNGSYVDSANLTFWVLANNSGGGNQTNTGCGYDSNYTAVYAYSWQSIFNVGNMFESTVNSYCNLLGTTTMIEWTVHYPSNWTIVAQGNTSWYVNSTSDSLTVNHAAFDAGNYAFLAKLSVWDTNGAGWNFITDSVYNFSYVDNNGNLSSGGLDIDTNANNFFTGDTIEVAYESTELIIGEMYNLAWSVYDENQNVVDSGNWSWLAYTNTSLEWLNYTVDGAPISAGGYCFVGILYHVDANYSATWIAQDDTCVHVYTNSTGGGGNNTSQTQLDCTNLDNNATIDGEVVIYNVSSQYGQDDEVRAFIEVCWTPTNVSMWYEVWLNHTTTNTMVQDWSAQGSGNFPSWSQSVEYGPGHIAFPMRDLYPTAGAWDLQIDSLPYGGTYCFEARLKVFDTTYGAFFVTDHDGPMCFLVAANSTGGNNTTNDSDNDGVSDDVDNCPYNANPNQEDLDNDGVGDECDPDGDGDGVNNSVDDFPADPAEWMDSDNDDVGDNSDNCPNVANADQSDADNNGIGDACDSNTGGNGNNTNTNTPPVIAGVTISPNMPQSDDNLTCMYTTFDAEGDTVTATVVWKVNGNIIASGTDTLSIGYAVGDEVECVVSGSDGQAPGNTDSDTVTILPTVSDVDDGTGNGLPALGSVGTLLAVAIGVGLARRQDE